MIKVFFQPGAATSTAMNDIVKLEAREMFQLPPGIEWPFTPWSEPAKPPRFWRQFPARGQAKAMGKSRLEAARDGTQEVSGAILAGTATTLAIFLPAIFLTGMIKYLFAPLSLAATLTIGASYLLALTVVPAFCATFVRPGKRDNIGTLNEGDSSNHATAGGYTRLLGMAMRVPAAAALMIVGCVGASFLLLLSIGTELFPQVDSGAFELRIKTLPGTELIETEKIWSAVLTTRSKSSSPKEKLKLSFRKLDCPLEWEPVIRRCSVSIQDRAPRISL